MKYFKLLLLILMLGLVSLPAQTGQALVSINENTPVNDAIQILEIYAQRETAKKILNMSSFGGVIGIPLNNLAWSKALDLI
ncbi:MAG TPA: hypothetical protein P5533_05470, partial [Candidatus Cloacimonadota bacterium]|nr:hypothetical protein [Candidatus Cloacimonadota bacterium]